MRNHETRTWTHLWRTTNLFNAFENAKFFSMSHFVSHITMSKLKAFQQKKLACGSLLTYQKVCVHWPSTFLLSFYDLPIIQIFEVYFACCESASFKRFGPNPRWLRLCVFFPPWSHRHERRIAASMQHMWSKTCGKWHLDFHRWWKSITSWIMSCLLLLIIHVLNGIKWKQMNSCCRIPP